MEGFTLSTEIATNESNMTNVTDTMPTESKENIELYVVMGILSFLSVMGTAGNAIVLYVFSQKKDKQVSTLFIIILAFVDFITCLIVIPYTIYMEYVNFSIDSDALCKIYQFLITSNIPFSAMIMVAIAVDRYFCICHPFLHALNIQRAKIMIGTLAMMAIVIGICVALMFGVYEIVPVPVLQLNDTHWKLDIRDNLTKNDLTIYSNIDVETSPLSYENYESWTKQNYMNNPLTQPHDNHTETINTTNIIRFSGECKANEILINATSLWYYQKFYTALYLVCLIIVIVLYTMIYNSVLARRTKRQNQKSKSLPLIQMSSERTIESTTEETMLTVDTEINGDSKNTLQIKNGSTSAAAKAREKEQKEKEKQKRKSMKKDRNRMANLKTAAMLFVVTVVFIVTFCPAFLMANELIPYNMTVFYMYFANNVANPIIYSFMNKNFRDDLKKIFCRRR